MPRELKPKNPLMSLPRCAGRTVSMPATSRASMKTLSPTPMRKTAARRAANHGVTTTESAAAATTAGPPRSASRGPSRSTSTPATGCPTKRPTAWAVTTWAATPIEISKDVARTGIVGTTMP